MAKTITKDSFFHSRLQQFVANSFFQQGPVIGIKTKATEKRAKLMTKLLLEISLKNKKPIKNLTIIKNFKAWI